MTTTTCARLEALRGLLRRFSLPLALLSALLLAVAAPYLLPANPDSAVFRSGTLGLILLLAAVCPIRHALEHSSLRALVFGCIFALIFALCLGLGSELVIYDGLLPGMGSLLRRVAVPVMATPALGALASFAFSFAPRPAKKPRRTIPAFALFLLIALCYTAVLLAFFPGVISYDFEHEIRQFTTGVYEAAHPVFHTLFLGTLFAIGEKLFGSMTAGAAMYSVVQLLLLAAIYAWACGFVQKRVLGPIVTLALAAGFAILPFHGMMAIATAKDPLFAGLCVVIVLLLWEIAENPDAFLASKFRMIRFGAVCLLMALLRHNAVFAFGPACLAVVILCRGKRRRALLAVVCALAACVLVPKGFELAVGAQKAPSSEMMSVPCQQLMRTAARADDLTPEEYDEISAWFSGAINRYRPHCADPAKGGNFDFARYQQNPGSFWRLYAEHAVKHPRIYIEAFLENCVGLWNPDDISHAHSLSSEESDYIYLNAVYPFEDGRYPIEAGTYLRPLRRLIYAFTHNSVQQKYPVLAQIFCPAVYVLALLLISLRLGFMRRGRLALCTLPLWGIALSLLFSAGIFVRYAYPIMAGVPVLLALAFFAPDAQSNV